MTEIKWTDTTWSPVVGCRPVSPGCANCYAAVLAANRLVPQKCAGYVVKGDESRTVARDGKWTGAVNLVPEKLNRPRRWREPRRIFVCSMSDLFHEDVPDDFLDEIFDVMELESHHTFQVLTKRPERMRDYVRNRQPAHLLGGEAPNIWLGVSVEDRQRFEERVPILRQTAGAVHWLSIEPLLGPLCIGASDLYGIDWVVAGGESGTRHRPTEAGWVREIRDACVAAGVPFFFKQWSQARQPPKDEPVLLDGREWNMYPGDSHL